MKHLISIATSQSLSGNFTVIGALSAISYLGLPSTVVGAYKEVSANYTILLTDYTINCTANNFTVQLPTAVGITGQIFNVKNSGAGNITLSGFGAQLIDASNTSTFGKPNSMNVQSTGSNWIIL